VGFEENFDLSGGVGDSTFAGCFAAHRASHISGIMLRPDGGRLLIESICDRQKIESGNPDMRKMHVAGITKYCVHRI
jgi:hypothetical protein